MSVSNVSANPSLDIYRGSSLSIVWKGRTVDRGLISFMHRASASLPSPSPRSKLQSVHQTGRTIADTPV